MTAITTAATTTCAACAAGHGEVRMSRHVVSDGWLTYYRCRACNGVSAVHTGRQTWTG